MNTIKQGINFNPSEEKIEVEREYENLHDFEGIHAMNEDVNQEVPPHVNPNLDLPQLPW